MDFADNFSLLLRSRYPLLYIPTFEEERLEQAIADIAKNLGRAIYLWDFVEGYTANPTDAGFAKRNPLQALEFVDKISHPALFLLRDFDRFLEDVAIARKLKNLNRRLKELPQNIILLATQIAIPPTLQEILTVVELSLIHISEPTRH